MIPTGSSLSVLLINEQAEESKLVSTNLRSFFPDCRIEAVYSSDEAIQWSARSDWHLILVDENLSPRGGVDILQELKRACPYAAIILQTDRSDSTSALHALTTGSGFSFVQELTGLYYGTLYSIRRKPLRNENFKSSSTSPFNVISDSLKRSAMSCMNWTTRAALSISVQPSPPSSATHLRS